MINFRLTDLADGSNRQWLTNGIDFGMFADATPELLEVARLSLETLELVCKFLNNGTPIHQCSDLHADIVAHRDFLKCVLRKAIR